VHFDNLLIASIERPPVLGSTIKALDDSAARKVKGVVAIERLDGGAEPPLFKPLGGVAVLAHNTWTALQARKQLQITWSDTSHSDHDSDTYLKTLQQAVQEPGKSVSARGDVDSALAATAPPTRCPTWPTRRWNRRRRPQW